VIGPINPKSSKGHSYIVIATDYFTKWQEATALRNANSDQLIHFLKENILSRFGVQEKFITDNGSIFIGSEFTRFYAEYGIVMGQSSNYYPQGNGMAESTNKTLIQIIKKTIEANHENWHNKLIDALWASRLTPKKGTRHSPFTLVYGKEARVPLHMELNALKLVVNDDEDEKQSPMQRRYMLIHIFFFC
jgi:transposase InsO family protein